MVEKNKVKVGWLTGLLFVILQHNLKQIKVMELKYKLIEEIMSELNMRNSENVLKCFERLLEEMSSNKLKGILEDLQEERTI